MFKNEIEFFNELDELIKKYPYEEKTDTVLSVIGRKYDEDLISRIVVYIIEKDQDLQIQLLKHSGNYFLNGGLTLDYVSPEYKMEQGRADIFASFNNGNLTLTIENKIKTWEHSTGTSMQTEVYQKHVEKHHKDAQNFFLYLKPGWNESKPKSSAFKVITYSELLEMISLEMLEHDPIIKDFSEHIKSYLGDKKMVFTDLDERIYKNIEKYTSCLNNVKNKVIAYKTDLIHEIINEISQNHLKKSIIDCKEWSNNENDDGEDWFFEVANYSSSIGAGSFRLYKRKWRRNDDYLFFAEIKFGNGMLDDICFQSTLRSESNQNTSKLKEFITDCHHIPWNIKNNSGKYHVYTYKRYEQHTDFFSNNNEWEDIFIKESSKCLFDKLTETEKLYREYCEYNK